MAARDAAVEIVRDVEEGAVAVGNPGVEPQQRRVDGAADTIPATFQQLDRAAGPYGPMPQQSSTEAQGDRIPVPDDGEGRHEVKHDVVVVAGIECYALLRLGLHQAADDVERAISIERRVP